MEPRTTEDFFGLVGYQLDGKYNIEAVVARGGFGVVYRARHAVLHTQIAVKVLRVPDDTSSAARERFLEQFVEEARIVALLQHPSIVRVTDFGVSTMHDNTQAPWMVLEWIEGQTLAASLNARKGAGGRSPRECLDVLRPVIDALATAHDAGIAHRDIKPGNIMLPADRPATRSRAAPRAAPPPSAARVLDFGIAKTMGEGDDGPVTGLTQTHSVAPSFSPRYASPEQASGTRTGPWTDVHALGLILTEMLTDIAVFPSADKMELHVKVMSPTRPTPAQFGVDVGAWEPVLARALALRPADRYPNAGELLAALEADVPELGRPTTPDAPPAVDASTTARHRAVAVDTGPTLSPTERIARSPRRDAHRAIGAAAILISVGLIALGAALGARHRADGVLAPRASSMATHP
jgi:serine/threonine-protein kinase